MLPEILASSYSKYKEDTKVFTTWLSQAAVACGYKPEEKESTGSTGDQRPLNGGIDIKLTGKARKEAKLKAEAEKKEKRSKKKKLQESGPRVVKHTITTNDLLQQAELISKSIDKNIEVPTGLKKVIERAIAARRRCAAWFRTSKVDNQYSNAAHEHFIEVLEKALVILEPRLDVASATKKKEAAAKAKKDDEAILELSNRYYGLEIEDFDDSDDLEDIISSIEGDNATAGQAVVNVFELEEESNTMQISMMIFCFFEDMHVIQAFLHDIWQSYKDGTTSLIIASFITNAAFDLVRRNEEEILKLAPDLFERKRSYETIAMIIYFADAFSRNEDPQEKLKSNESLRPTPFDDFIYLSVSRTLMKFVFLANFPDGGNNLQYPVPIVPLRFTYISRPELLELPAMKKREAEDRLLTQFFIDLQLYNGCKHDLKKWMPGRTTPPLDDEISKGLRQLAVDGTVSVWLVFSCRVWLDINGLLGDQIGRARSELFQQAEEVETTLESTGAFEDNQKSIRWLTVDAGVAQNLMSTSGEWILKNFLPFFKRDALSRMPVDFGRSLTGDFEKAKDFESAGTSLALTIPKERNARDGLISFDKFQNDAAKKVNMRGFRPPKDVSFTSLKGAVTRIDKHPRDLTETEWKDVQKVIRSKAGLDDEPPSEEHEQNARRLNIRMIMPHEDENFLFAYNPLYCGTVSLQLAIDTEKAGLSLSNYHTVISNIAHLYKAVQRAGFINEEWLQMEQMIAMHTSAIFEDKIPRSSHEACRRYMKSMGIYQLMAGRFSAKDGPQCKVNSFSQAFRQYFDQTASNMNAMTSTKALVQEKVIEALESKQKRRNARRNFTSQQFLVALRDFLPAVIPNITFDYFTLLQTCYCLIEEIRQSIEHDLRKSIPLRKMLEDSTQPAYLTMTHGILEEAKDGNDSKLKVAGKVLEAFIKNPQPRTYVVRDEVDDYDSESPEEF